MAPMSAFTAETVRRVTGLSDRQLRYWDDTGFFSPSYADEDRSRPHSRIYSFRDLVGLRTLARLRNKHGIPLQELRRVAAKLAEKYTEPWSSLKFYTVGKRVYFGDPDTGTIMATRAGAQTLMRFDMLEIARQTEEDVKQLRKRQPDQVGKISRHRYVMHNAPVVASTRIPVSVIRDLRDAGRTIPEILEDYPQLTAQDVQRALDFEEEPGRQRLTG